MTPPRLTPVPAETRSLSSLAAVRNLVACHCPLTLAEVVFLGRLRASLLKNKSQFKLRRVPMLEPQMPSN